MRVPELRSVLFCLASAHSCDVTQNHSTCASAGVISIILCISSRAMPYRFPQPLGIFSHFHLRLSENCRWGISPSAHIRRSKLCLRAPPPTRSISQHWRGSTWRYVFFSTPISRLYPLRAFTRWMVTSDEFPLLVIPLSRTSGLRTLHAPVEVPRIAKMPYDLSIAWDR